VVELKSVLVTGGAGYIGSTTARLLSESGFIPVVLDNLSQGKAENVKWGPLIVGDLCDRKFIQQVFEDFEVTAVIHFAAKASVSESIQDPIGYYSHNVLSTLNLLEAMLKARVEAIIFSSSCSTYGEYDSEEISEDFEQRPINPYGLSKLIGERVIQDVARRSNISYAILRYFNVAGADLDGLIHEEHEPEHHLIPRILSAITTGHPLTIFGSDFPTPDGTAVRDFVHVVDLAHAHVLALKQLLGGKDHLILNLGAGKGYSVKQIVDTFNLMGMPVPVQFGPRREGDPARLVSNISRAKSLLGWTPVNSDILNVLESVIFSQGNRNS
jgi:UDP-glucose-4-epimerase GalE